MKVMLVDDEWIALALTEMYLKEIDGIEISGKFLDVKTAIVQISLCKPDVVFLDIEMPEINGLEAADIIQKESPQTEIIFVTAHDRYALDAFNVEAFDYLLKPVEKWRLLKAIERVRKRTNTSKQQLEAMQEQSLQEVILKCMGKLQIQKEGEEPSEMKWRTAKIKELFAYLLHNHHQVVSKDVLIELLWSDIEEKKGITNLQTSIYRIRQLLKELALEDIISINYSQFGYILQFTRLAIDVEVWHDNLMQLPPISSETITLHQQLFEQYVGDYFGEDNYYWAEWEGQRLKMLWLQHANDLAEYYTAKGKNLEVLSLYHRVVQHDPMQEESHLAIMRLYDQLNDRNSVIKHYQLMVNMLEKEAGVGPGTEVTEWYAKWKNMNEIMK